MQRIFILELVIAVFLIQDIGAQERVGINTILPPAVRLEMAGHNEQYFRIESTTSLNTEVGVELIRGNGPNSTIDWKIANNSTGLTIASSNDDFVSNNVPRIILDNNGYLGIAMSDPDAPLHIMGGSNASNVDDGFMMIGPQSGVNTVFDTDGFLSRLNGSPTSLFVQNHGGMTQFGLIGTSHVLVTDGKVVAGGGPDIALLNIRDDDQFAINLSNDSDGDLNSWRISATAGYWSAGGDKLVFAPNSASSSAVLRLLEADENNGSEAPVEIRSAPNEALFIDGNEIDSESQPLYINSNSDHDILINPTGGQVGIGTTSIEGLLQVSSDGFALAIQKAGKIWRMTPAANGDMLISNVAHGPVALVSENNGGQWVPISDSTRKENIVPVRNAMDMISQITLHRYQFKSDSRDRQKIGVLAQELEQVMPEAVAQLNGQYGVMYDQLTALALAGVKEQQLEIETLLQQCQELKHE